MRISMGPYSSGMFEMILRTIRMEPEGKQYLVKIIILINIYIAFFFEVTQIEMERESKQIVEIKMHM